MSAPPSRVNGARAAPTSVFIACLSPLPRLMCCELRARDPKRVGVDGRAKERVRGPPGGAV